MLPLLTNLRYKQFPWMTYSLIAINILVFICEMSLRDHGTLHGVVRNWTYTVGKAEIAFATGYPDLVFHVITSLFVAMFLHVNFMHLVTNMTFLYALGPALEAQLGRAKFLCFYIASGLSATAYFAYNGEVGAELMGASGALGGLIGAFLVFWPRARITVLMGVKVMTSNAVFLLLDFIALQIAAYWFGLNISAGSAMNVAYAAHIGGIAFGVSFAICWRSWQFFKPSQQTAKVLVPPYQRELYDTILDWLEAGIAKCWRATLWLVYLPVRGLSRL